MHHNRSTQSCAGWVSAADGHLNMTDASLREVFTRLYEENVERLYRYALVCTGNISDAQDLTSDVFYAAMKSFNHYQPGKGSAVAWLMGIAHHKWVDHLRRDREPITMEAIEERPDGNLCPEEMADQHIQLDQVIAVLRRLPPARAEALALVFFGGLSMAEAGAVMGENVDAVGKLISRGLADLKKVLASQQEQRS